MNVYLKSSVASIVFSGNKSKQLQKITELKGIHFIKMNQNFSWNHINSITTLVSQYKSIKAN